MLCTVYEHSVIFNSIERACQPIHGSAQVL